MPGPAHSATWDPARWEAWKVAHPGIGSWNQFTRAMKTILPAAAVAYGGASLLGAGAGGAGAGVGGFPAASGTGFAGASGSLPAAVGAGINPVVAGSGAAAAGSGGLLSGLGGQAASGLLGAALSGAIGGGGSGGGGGASSAGPVPATLGSSPTFQQTPGPGQYSQQAFQLAGLLPPQVPQVGQPLPGMRIPTLPPRRQTGGYLGGGIFGRG